MIKLVPKKEQEKTVLIHRSQFRSEFNKNYVPLKLQLKEVSIGPTNTKSHEWTRFHNAISHHS